LPDIKTYTFILG